MQRKTILFRFLMLLLLLAFAEGASYLAGTYLETKGIFYKPRIGRHVAWFLPRRDPVLGWPSPLTFGTFRRDRTGSRFVPAFPDPAHGACVSLYGDSFTWGSEVDDNETWGNRLAQRLNCRVANYGVRGYGTDQAYLRYVGNTNDTAEIVILAHTSENILRNVCRFINLLYPGDRYGFKPRFTLAPDGSLERLPPLEVALDHYPHVVRWPERYLAEDWFVPGGPGGALRLEFPFSMSMVRVFGHFHVKALLAHRPRYAEFYAPDHPSRALPVTAAVMRAFRAEALRRRQRPLVVVLPTHLDLVHFRRSGEWVYQPLLDRLRDECVPFLDLGPGLNAHVGTRAPENFVHSRSGHYDAELCGAVAALLSEELELQDNLR